MITKEKIEKLLKNYFRPKYIFVGDDSYLHAGHDEAIRTGGKHFSLIIVCAQFEGKTLIQRHRMIYDVLKEGMGKEIHALAIKTLTPKEYKKKKAF